MDGFPVAPPRSRSLIQPSVLISFTSISINCPPPSVFFFMFIKFTTGGKALEMANKLWKCEGDIRELEKGGGNSIKSLPTFSLLVPVYSVHFGTKATRKEQYFF